jgi:hypothetical protein
MDADRARRAAHGENSSYERHARSSADLAVSDIMLLADRVRARFERAAWVPGGGAAAGCLPRRTASAFRGAPFRAGRSSRCWVITAMMSVRMSPSGELRRAGRTECTSKRGRPLWSRLLKKDKRQDVDALQTAVTGLLYRAQEDVA